MSSTIGAARRLERRPDRRDVDALVDELLQRVRERLVADDDGAGDGVLAERQADVGVAALRLHDRLVAQLRPDLAVAAREALEVGVGAVAHGADDRRVQPGQPGDVDRRVLDVRAGGLGGHVEPRDPALEQRGVPQHLQLAVPGAGVGGLGDVAGGVDVGVAGAQVLVHEDPALAREPGRARELDARAHADRGGDDVAGDHVAAAGLHRRHLAAPPTDGGQVGERGGSPRPRARSASSMMRDSDSESTLPQ